MMNDIPDVWTANVTAKIINEMSATGIQPCLYGVETSDESRSPGLHVVFKVGKVNRYKAWH